jgi:hypothetical protein
MSRKNKTKTKAKSPRQIGDPSSTAAPLSKAASSSGNSEPASANKISNARQPFDYSADATPAPRHKILLLVSIAFIGLWIAALITLVILVR